MTFITLKSIGKSQPSSCIFWRSTVDMWPGVFQLEHNSSFIRQNWSLLLDFLLQTVNNYTKGWDTWEFDCRGATSPVNPIIHIAKIIDRRSWLGHSLPWLIAIRSLSFSIVVVISHLLFIIINDPLQNWFNLVVIQKRVFFALTRSSSIQCLAPGQSKYCLHYRNEIDKTKITNYQRKSLK